MRDAELWNRLSEYAFDAPGAKLTFAARLARENGWSIARAKRAIEEYKRFCYLAMTAGHPVTPSEDVDQVWHLHLVYTRSYWQDFCPNVLGKPLHHGPTKGGAEESAKHDDWYRRTLASYRDAFGPPPADLWPDSETRFDHDIAWRRVNRHDYWLVRKPDGKRLLPGLAAAIGLLFLAGCTGNPLDWNGPEFLGLYIPLLIVFFLGVLILRRLLANAPSSDSENLTLHEIAYLQGQKPRLFLTATTDLVRRGHLIVEQDQLRTGNPLASDASPVDRAVFDAIAAHGVAKAAQKCNPETEAIHRRLVERGLVVCPERAAGIVLLSLAVMFAIMLFGILKIVVGSQRGKPVGYLVVATVVAAILSLCLLARPFLTGAGRQAMRERRRENVHMRQGIAEWSAGDPQVSTAVALYGVGALAAGAFVALHPILRPLPGSANSAGATSGGCSTMIGCGSDGGGGDGGGGGCGGCGGGD